MKINSLISLEPLDLMKFKWLNFTKSKSKTKGKHDETK